MRLDNLQEIHLHGTRVLFSPNTGAFQVSHAQASFPGRKYISRPFRITCLLVLDPKIGASGQFSRNAPPWHVRVVFAQHRRISGAARPSFVPRTKVYIKTIQNHMLACFRSKNWCVWTIFKKCASMARACCFRPTQAHFRCRTPKLRSQDESIYQDHSESHACLF